MAMADYWIARDGEKHGPHPEDQVRRNYASGRVRPTDLLWTEGMADWKAASQVLGPVPPRAPTGTAASATPYQPPAAVVRDEGDAGTGGEAVYAGFWVRFGTVIIDTLIVYIIAFVAGGAVGVALGLVGSTEAAGGGAMIAGIVGGFLYFALMESSERGATLGKRAFHLRVVTAEGHGRIGFGRAAGRYFARFVSMIVLYIGYLIQPFTRRKQALHDMICGTAVVALAPASRVLLGITIVLGLLMPAGIVAAISIPAYQDYAVRAGVAEALLAATPARDAVSAYVAQRNTFPKSLADAGAQADPTPRLQSIAIDPRSGVLTLTLGFAPVEGRTILMVPRRAEGTALTWRCRPGTVRPNYLPRSCRNG
jgi:uncharacterized RDD family membrane protein YckC